MALLARAAEGSMRDALSLMDQLIAFGGGRCERGQCAHRCSAPSIAAMWAGSSMRWRAADGAALLAEVQELDRDAPDYDRALIELATLPAAHSHRANRARSGASGRGVRCRRC